MTIDGKTVTASQDAPGRVFWTQAAADAGQDGGLGALAAALAAGQRPVVICRSLTDTLTAAMAAGTAPSAAAADWRTETAALLDLYRKGRRALVIVQDRALRSGDARALGAVSRQLGHALPGLPARPEAEPLRAVLAAQFALAAPDLLALDAELLASSHSQDPVPPAPDLIDAAFHAAQTPAADPALAEAERDRARLEQLRIDLSDQLRMVQDDLGTHAREAAGLRQRLSDMDAAVRSRTAAVQEAEQRLATLATESERALAAEIALRAEDAARHAAQITDLTTAMTAAQEAQAHEIAWLQSEHQRFYTSWSWRVAAPMRGVRRGFDKMRGRG